MKACLHSGKSEEFMWTSSLGLSDISTCLKDKVQIYWGSGSSLKWCVWFVLVEYMDGIRRHVCARKWTSLAYINCIQEKVAIKESINAGT